MSKQVFVGQDLEKKALMSLASAQGTNLIAWNLVPWGDG